MSEAYLFKERYLAERELGRGGNGVVYLVHDNQLHSKPVVVKVLLASAENASDRSWYMKRFHLEIKALARLNHPSIVSVLDAGETADGKPFIVMELVRGVTLRTVLKSHRLDLSRVARIVHQIGQALSTAHDCGISHRDLKPENVMLQELDDKEEWVKLIDFGIAAVADSQADSSTDVRRIAGTLGYMAPEQLMGQPSPLSDIFAFGVIAYEMVTGSRPFGGKLSTEQYELQRAGVKVVPTALRPDLPSTAEQVILRALSFTPGERHQRARDFGDELSRALTIGAQQGQVVASLGSGFGSPSSTSSAAVPGAPPSFPEWTTVKTICVALLYKRDAQPDEHVLALLEAQFAARGYHVFIDRHLSIGVEWAKEIERQVRTADVVVPLLSAASVSSEMLAYEVQIAHDAAQAHAGKPRLLPVRIKYDGALPQPLAAILNPIQYAVWNGPADDASLIARLIQGMASNEPGRAVQERRKLEPVGGAVPLDSAFYLLRSTDEEFQSAIARQDSIVLVKGARQMGKTSLLARGLQGARARGIRVALTDFQVLNATHLESIETFFLTVAEMLVDQLDLDVVPTESWSSRRGPSMNFSHFMRREVFEKITGPVVWGMDEVDRLFTCSFGSEVFGLFRSWHNARSLDPGGPWARLTLAIAYATEAHLFITDLNQSPFNVGTRLALDDFTSEQVAELNDKYGRPLRDAAEIERYFRLVGGHPYLVRRGLHEMASAGLSMHALESRADREEGPFGDHLRRILVLLAQDPGLEDVVRDVLRGKPCPTPESFYRLRSAGVMSGDAARDVRVRCQLYATYLTRHLL